MLSRVVVRGDVSKRLFLFIYKSECLSTWKPRDSGPEKNYRKKIKKALKKEGAKVSSDFLDKLQTTERQVGNEKSEPVDLSDVLHDIKVHVRSDMEVRRNLGMPENQVPPTSFKTTPRGSTTTQKLSFTEGERLNIFNKPSDGVPVMSAEEWNFHKEDEIRQIDLLNSLRPHSNAFERLMEKDSQSVWKYPIDNEAYKNDEEEVGFEQHVFLDKELRHGFPKKGPVRHFMELVVTGLASNPYLSVEDKHSHIEWYREYFSQFPEDELHTVLPSEMSDDHQSNKHNIK